MGISEVLNIEEDRGLYTVYFTDGESTYDQEEMQELVWMFADKKQYSDATKLLKALMQ